MDEYDLVKTSKLKFKGEHKKEKPTKISRKQSNHTSPKPDEKAKDAADHGDWWIVTDYKNLGNYVAVEFQPGCYARALSNGKVSLGEPHPPGDGPDEEEIFMAIPAGTNQIALKSGFGRFLTIGKKERLGGLSEAVGEREKFTIVFEDGKTALKAQNDCFLAVGNEIDSKRIFARPIEADSNKWLNIRS